MQREQKQAYTQFEMDFFLLLSFSSFDSIKTHPFRMWTVWLFNSQRDYSRKFKPKRESKKKNRQKKNTRQRKTHSFQWTSVCLHKICFAWIANGATHRIASQLSFCQRASRELLLSKFNSTKENANFFSSCCVALCIVCRCPLLARFGSHPHFSPIFSWYLIVFVLLNASRNRVMCAC